MSLSITLLLAAHLLAMNVAAAGPLAGVWLATRCNDIGPVMGRRVYRLSLASLMIGSLLGGCLILIPNDSLRAVLSRFPSDTYWFAGLELLFSAACIAALVIGGERLGKRRFFAFGLALLSATNLLYHFPPLMAVIGELAANPAWAADQSIDRAALLRLWRRPEVLALWAHFTLASLAVAPVAAIWPWSRRQTWASAPEIQATTRRLGAWALAASALQIPVGLWLLSTSSHAARESLMGSDLIASMCFAGGVLAALWLLQTLLATALSGEHRDITRAGYLLIVVTVLMTATLRASRQATAERPLAASLSSAKDLSAAAWSD